MRKVRKLLMLGLFMMLLPLIVNAKELSSLKVRGIEEELSTKNNWNLTYVSPRDSMVVDAILNNSSNTVEGVGRIPLQEGANTHVVIVKDNSGNEIEKYVLNVSFSHSRSTISNNTFDNLGDGKVPTNPSTGYFINFPIVIVFCISFGLILFSKKKKIYKI